MAIAFYLVLTISCINDIIAYHLDISLNAMTWIGRHRHGDPASGRVLRHLPVLPGSAARSDRAVLEHGIETGIIKRLPHGEYVEIHQPLGPVDDHGHPIPLEYQGAAIPKKMNKLGSAGKPARVAGSPRTRSSRARRSRQPITRLSTSS